MIRSRSWLLTLLCLLLLVGLIILVSAPRAAKHIAESVSTAPGISKAKISPFTIVFIDEQSAATLGRLPYDRGIIANGVEECAKLHAKAVVLLFFFSTARSPQGDLALATAIPKVRVVLESGYATEVLDPNPIPERFFVNGIQSDIPKTLTFSSIWAPLPIFSSAAYDMGFVNVDKLTLIPLYEKYQERYVKSLWTSCLEIAVGRTITSLPKDQFRLGQFIIDTDNHGQVAVDFPAKDSLPVLSFNDLLLETVPVESIKDRIVIIGCDTSDMPTIMSPLGAIRVHRAFCLSLMSLYERTVGEKAKIAFSKK